MARAGMANPITQLRAATAAGTADYSIGAITYWSDDQLQREFDKVRTEWRDVDLLDVPVQLNNGTQYFDYYIPDHVEGIFEESGVNSGWLIKDSNGGSVNSALYTINYDARMISFLNNTGGSVYRLDVRAYNMERAAANVWRWKAANVANRVDWSSDNHRFNASQEYDQCTKQAQFYERMAGLAVGMFYRTDEV